MKSISMLRRFAALAALGAVYAGPVSAQDTGQMTVTANVAPSCQLQGIEAMAFGTLNPAADNDAQADITWVCTSGQDADIELDGGAVGDITARAMGGSGSLPYQLYVDSARTQLFGDGTDGDLVPVSGTGYGSPSQVTVYGRVDQADAAAAAAGNYTDTINVTISF